MNYSKALRKQKQFERTRKKFEKQKGIIQPIRAVVIDIEKCCTVEGRNATLNVICGKVAECMSSCRSMTSKFGFTKKAIRTFNKTSRHVGYIAAVKDSQGNISYGLSYCFDYDFRRFNREFGRELAMRRAMENGVDLTAAIGDSDFVNSSTDSSVIYVWPVTYGEQVKYFIRRAENYFAQ